jgi:hypothetical protein
MTGWYSWDHMAAARPTSCRTATTLCNEADGTDLRRRSRFAGSLARHLAGSGSTFDQRFTAFPEREHLILDDLGTRTQLLGARKVIPDHQPSLYRAITNGGDDE